MDSAVLTAIISGSATVLVALITNIVAMQKVKADNKKEINKETTAIKEGVKAMLRSQIVSAYEKAHSKGYAPIYARENFQGLYEQYKALGGNGVIEDIHEKFFQLPTSIDGGATE